MNALVSIRIVCLGHSCSHPDVSAKSVMMSAKRVQVKCKMPFAEKCRMRLVTVVGGGGGSDPKPRLQF